MRDMFKKRRNRLVTWYPHGGGRVDQSTSTLINASKMASLDPISALPEDCAIARNKTKKVGGGVDAKLL